MIDAGADLIIGHGPHTVRGIEYYKGKVIAYSLGNFLGYLGFNTSGILRYSMILKVTLDKAGKTKKLNVVPLELSRQAVPSLDPQGFVLTVLNDLGKSDFPERAILLDQNGDWTPSTLKEQ